MDDNNRVGSRSDAWWDSWSDSGLGRSGSGSPATTVDWSGGSDDFWAIEPVALSSQPAPSPAPREKPAERKWVRRALLSAIIAILLLIAFAIPLGISRLAPAGAGPQAATPAQSSSPAAPPGAGMPSDAVAATVVAVVDGDTIDTDLGRVRLYGIDAPERGDSLSSEATDALAAAVPVGSTVWLWKAPGGDDQDPYGRLVRVVYAAPGQDAGSQLVESGLATAYTSFSDRYVPQQETAREAGVGLWADDPAGEAGDARELGRDRASTGGETEEDSAASQRDASAEPWNQPGPDLDCADIIGGPVQVLPPDYHNLDGDGDGWGCEW